MTNPKIQSLFDESTIATRIDELAIEIAAKNFKNLLVVAILKGSFIFAADLARAMHRANLSPEMEFIHLSSYGAGTHSTGEVKVLRDVESDVKGRDVLLIDDILESGRTLEFAQKNLLERGARSVQIVALLDKSEFRDTNVLADFVGFKCPDKFVVGYGMDVGYAYRQLPYIGYIPDSE